MKNAQMAIERYARNGALATETWKEAIAAVTENPCAKAAAASEAYLTGVQRAESEGKRAAALNRVSVTQWKAACNAKATRLSAGIAQGKEKYARYITGYMAAVPALKAQLAQMPKGGRDAALARFTAAYDFNVQFASQQRRS